MFFSTNASWSKRQLSSILNKISYSSIVNEKIEATMATIKKSLDKKNFFGFSI